MSIIEIILFVVLVIFAFIIASYLILAILFPFFWLVDKIVGKFFHKWLDLWT